MRCVELLPVLSVLICAASARQTGTKAGIVQQQKFYCSPVVNTDPFCEGLTATSVCTEDGNAVDGSELTQSGWSSAQPEFCPKARELFTKKIFCRGGLRPPLPCKEASDCDIPTSLKQCYGLCLFGGTGGETTVLGAEQCSTETAQATCNAAVGAGEVAGPMEKKCLGISDFVEQESRQGFGKEVFQPRKCEGTFPIGNHQFKDLDHEGRKQFALELTMKVNAMLGYCRLSENQTTWVNKKGDESCLSDMQTVYSRPRDIRAQRVQMLNGYPTVFIGIKQFCTIPLRKGEAVYLNGVPADDYCDAPSKDPEYIFQNLSAELTDNMGPDKSTPLTVGPYPRLKWDKKFEIPFGPNGAKNMIAQFPTRCFTYDPNEESEKSPPDWVWCIVCLSAMLLLLSMLILQHRYRNRVSYARSKRVF